MGLDIQGKLRVALGSVKDQASIGKAMIYHQDGFSDIEIAVVRATGHDHNPVSDKYMHEILFLVSNSPGSITFLAERLSHRLRKTRDRHVALKTLVLIHRLLRGGNRSFEQQLRGAHVSGHLQITTWWFPRNSNPSLSFLHKYAAYLEERMGWFINQAGKLEPIMTSKGLEIICYEERIIDMVFRRLPKCQEFLDKVLDCSPFDILPWDNLAQVAMSNTLKESFQVYMTFCEGVAALVNKFFDLTRPMRALACTILKRASQQSQELYDLYENCKKIIGNKSLEYPSVEIIKMDHVVALKQFSSSEPTNSYGSVGSTKSSGSSPPPPPPNRPQGTSPAKEGERDEQRSDTSLSSIVFSCTLETKISKVWVVFDEEEPKYESHVSVGKLFNSNRFGDISVEGRLGEIVSSRDIKYSKPCSSSISPFTSNCVGT